MSRASSVLFAESPIVGPQNIPRTISQTGQWKTKIPARITANVRTQGVKEYQLLHPEFVNNVLLPTLTSGGKGTVWCLEWREHPDAVTRLAAIWDAWSHLLAEEDAALHSFLRDVLDHHMPMLIDGDRGAFRRCNYGHKPAEQLNDVKPGTGKEADTATSRRS